MSKIPKKKDDKISIDTTDKEKKEIKKTYTKEKKLKKIFYQASHMLCLHLTTLLYQLLI